MQKKYIWWILLLRLKNGSIREPCIGESCNDDRVGEIFFCAIWQVPMLTLLIDFLEYSEQIWSNQTFLGNWDCYLGLAVVRELIIHQISWHMILSSIFVKSDISKIETLFNYNNPPKLQSIYFSLDDWKCYNGIFIIWFTYPNCCTTRSVTAKEKYFQRIVDTIEIWV